jgi:hypothetical protein
MKGLKTTIAILLGLMGCWLVVNGITIILQTMGPIFGTEFSMLITITNVLSGVAAWLGLYGLWQLIPNESQE